MAAVRAFQIKGLKVWFWSNDHEPPHFHVKRKGEWEVRVFFLLDGSEMIELVWGTKRPTKKRLKAIVDLATEHRVALLVQWEEMREQDA